MNFERVLVNEGDVVPDVLKLARFFVGQEIYPREAPYVVCSISGNSSFAIQIVTGVSFLTIECRELDNEKWHRHFFRPDEDGHWRYSHLPSSSLVELVCLERQLFLFKLLSDK